MKILRDCICLCLSFFIVSCAQRCSQEVDNTALVKERVKKFVELSAHTKSSEDRKTLQGWSIGELKRAFETMSEEDFKAHYLGEKIELQKFELEEPEFDQDRARVKYKVTIKNTIGSTPTEEVNEREAVLTSSRGEWYLDTIRPVGSDKLIFAEGMAF